jgi:hypothetical protein
MQFSSSKEFTIVDSGSKNEPPRGPFNPLALNLSKMPKQKGEVPSLESKELFKGNQNSIIPKLNIEKQKSQLEMTVTLGPSNNENLKFSQPESSSHPLGLNKEYASDRNSKGIYLDLSLHCQMLFLIFSLILTPERGTLDDLYWSRKPLEESMPHVLHYLHYHLNHYANQSIIPLLLKKVNSFITIYGYLKYTNIGRI